ncbi:hypothetical protein CORT_0A02400 [Candida orthopsilosis Co 90-125]|uniref:Mitochondrial peculiar membrane protein 1 n=1 Tax=Candida orthopsilosis (strain 90-125) TaxID=1136231 RepID=H8WW07_CANO9|nr:hypothetical protein CORT_0A02400 [Candida orthopsilosis Co 90-125]CCG20631.1 hypothetical protein CORT_0A02400 [Candida orthopsilosis Co 90-125]
MCNRHNKNTSFYDDSSDKIDLESSNSVGDLDKYVESFDKIMSSIGTLTNAIIDTSFDAGRELNDKAREWSFNWLFSPKDTRDYNDYNDCKPHFFNFPPFYQTRDADLNSDSGKPTLSDLWNNDGFRNFPFKFGSTPFGYRAYKGPSTRQYNDCLDKRGKALWDDQGYWRCLFPEAEVPVDVLDFKKKYFGDAVVSKEDFFKYMNELGANENSKAIDLKDKGTFFNTYEDYLSWRQEKYSELKKKREDEAKARAAKKSKVLESLKQKQSESADNDKYVTSTSIKSNVFTDMGTNEVKYVETKQECFNDGNCVVTKITKSKPIGATDWANVEEHTENSSSGSGNYANKGWFWK